MRDRGRAVVMVTAAVAVAVAFAVMMVLVANRIASPRVGLENTPHQVTPAPLPHDDDGDDD